MTGATDQRGHFTIHGLLPRIHDIRMARFGRRTLLRCSLSQSQESNGVTLKVEEGSRQKVELKVSPWRTVAIGKRGQARIVAVPPKPVEGLGTSGTYSFARRHAAEFMTVSLTTAILALASAPKACFLTSGSTFSIRHFGPLSGQRVRSRAADPYFIVLIILAAYGAHRYWMVYLYYKHKKNKRQIRRMFRRLARVTVQLPIFNEQYVVDRLLDLSASLSTAREIGYSTTR